MVDRVAESDQHSARRQQLTGWRWWLRSDLATAPDQQGVHSVRRGGRRGGTAIESPSGADSRDDNRARKGRYADPDQANRQSVMIGDEVTITVLSIKGNQVRVGINAPRHVAVHREEIYERIKREQLTAAAESGDPPKAVSGLAPPENSR